MILYYPLFNLNENKKLILLKYHYVDGILIISNKVRSLIRALVTYHGTELDAGWVCSVITFIQYSLCIVKFPYPLAAWRFMALILNACARI